MIELALPWPSRKLNPNHRMHWRSLAKLKAEYRQRCRNVTLAHVEFVRGDGGPSVEPPSGPLHLHLRFVPPDRRRYDRDNMLSSMKAGLDGMCEALEFDDGQFSAITLRFSEHPARPDGKVLVRIESDPLPNGLHRPRDAVDAVR